MRVSVFIQNEAGSSLKNRHDEKTLEFQRSERVSRPYPFPYGFIVGTTAADDLNVDCFVLTTRPLRSGEIVECDVLGLMEQIEDGEEDHNVLAGLPGEDAGVTPFVEQRLADFVANVFGHLEGKHVRAGRFLGQEAAAAHIQARVDPL